MGNCRKTGNPKKGARFYNFIGAEHPRYYKQIPCKNCFLHIHRGRHMLIDPQRDNTSLTRLAGKRVTPYLSRVFQSTGNGPAHSQGNGPLCKGGTRCSRVFSACVRRSSSLSTKLRGLSAHRRPSFFFF